MRTLCCLFFLLACLPTSLLACLPECLACLFCVLLGHEQPLNTSLTRKNIQKSRSHHTRERKKKTKKKKKKEEHAPIGRGRKIPRVSHTVGQSFRRRPRLRKARVKWLKEIAMNSKISVEILDQNLRLNLDPYSMGHTPFRAPPFFFRVGRKQCPEFPGWPPEK